MGTRADPQALGWPVASAKLAIGSSPGRAVSETNGVRHRRSFEHPIVAAVGDVDVAGAAHYPVLGKMQSSARQLSFTFQPCAQSFAG